VLVGAALRRTPDRPDPYVVQAALAGCHALAPSYEQTDWSAVISWYDVLLRVHDTPVVRLNRAVAVAQRDGAQAGLDHLDEITGLDRHPGWYAARAELLHRMGCTEQARDAWRQAAALETNPAVRRHLDNRLRDTPSAGR
jgi:RNA polymerase sigma-70 factor (ECF subfamily)